MCNCNIEKMLSERDALLVREYLPRLTLRALALRMRYWTSPRVQAECSSNYCSGDTPWFPATLTRKL